MSRVREAGKELESWLQAQWTHSQTDPNFPAGTHSKEREREDEGPVMQENESLQQQGQGLVQPPRAWDSAWKPGLLGADGLHLAEKGKSIISHRLAKLVGRVLKLLWEGTFGPSHSYQLNARASRRCPGPGEGSHVSRRAPEEQHKGIAATPKLHWGLD